MDKDQLAQKIYDVAHISGEFKLRSGQTSHEYFDKYRFEARPDLLKAIASHMKEMIPSETEVLAGLEMGGIPVAVALSFESGLPVVFVRKTPKDYGTCQFAEGLDVKGKRVTVIEDVITTGGQVVTSSEDLRGLGARITDVLCVINRGPNPNEKLTTAELNLHSLFVYSK